MGVRIVVSEDGIRRVRQVLKRTRARATDKWVKRALKKSAFLAIRETTLRQIIRGGKQAPDPKRLTSRTGNLRRSIGASFSEGPGFSQWGTQLGYGATHEIGGRVTIPSHTRRSRKGKSFKVRAYTANYPARPYIQPGLDVMLGDQIPDVFQNEWLKAIAAGRG